MSLLRRWFCVLAFILSFCLVGGCRSSYPSFSADTEHPTGTSQPADVSHPAEDSGADDSEGIVEVPLISQYPDYPTGCESVTAVMALHHAGVPISVENFVDVHLPCDDRFYEKDGLLYGPDPYAVFVGDPRSTYSYGCMAPVIEKALRSCVSKERTVVNTTGEDLTSLCRNYIDHHIPVILWATMEMRPVGSGKTWFLPDGRQFVWPAGEHCLLLVGYNEKEYIFNDPRHGATVAYDKKSVEVAYASLGKQSLVIQ